MVFAERKKCDPILEFVEIMAFTGMLDVDIGGLHKTNINSYVNVKSNTSDGFKKIKNWHVKQSFAINIANIWQYLAKVSECKLQSSYFGAISATLTQIFDAIVPVW